jgi:hypothetical protein
MRMPVLKMGSQILLLARVTGYRFGDHRFCSDLSTSNTESLLYVLLQSQCSETLLHLELEILA